MKAQRQDAVRTRKALLTAATAVFGEKGYSEATVAEICERAGANVAAINYHFGDKEELYKEAWRQSFIESIEKYPPGGGVKSEAPPMARLRGQVMALLRRITDENNRAFAIVCRELVNPTGLLEEVRDEELRPLRKRIHDLLREILGSKVSETDIRRCSMSIFGLCVSSILLSRIDSVKPDEDDLKKADRLEDYVDFVMDFSMAGMKAVRCAAEKRSQAPKKKAGRG
jgi:TetR/AcrR family transcriptional regulator, regulator of cefoperazone and chloramphenicol sensitivity